MAFYLLKSKASVSIRAKLTDLRGLERKRENMKLGGGKDRV